MEPVACVGLAATSGRIRLFALVAVVAPNKGWRQLKVEAKMGKKERAKREQEDSSGQNLRGKECKLAELYHLWPLSKLSSFLGGDGRTEDELVTPPCEQTWRHLYYEVLFDGLDLC